MMETVRREDLMTGLRYAHRIRVQMVRIPGHDSSRHGRRNHPCLYAVAVLDVRI